MHLTLDLLVLIPVEKVMGGARRLAVSHASACAEHPPPSIHGIAAASPLMTEGRPAPVGSGEDGNDVRVRILALRACGGRRGAAAMGRGEARNIAGVRAVLYRRRAEAGVLSGARAAHGSRAVYVGGGWPRRERRIGAGPHGWDAGAGLRRTPELQRGRRQTAAGPGRRCLGAPGSVRVRRFRAGCAALGRANRMRWERVGNFSGTRAGVMMTPPARVDARPKGRVIMVNIIRFPARARHGDTRAASVANRSAVSPAALAAPDRRIGSHHSAGMLSRCRHLRTAEAPAPISAAIVSGDDHRSTTPRNVEMERIDSFLGQLVLERKSILSHDLIDAGEQDVLMADNDEGRMAYRDAFIARVRAAREARGLTQEQVAKALGLDQGTYKQYEVRSLLPLYFIERFCIITGAGLAWLLDAEEATIRPQPRRQRRAKGRRRPAA